MKPMRYLGVKIPDELDDALKDTGRPKSEVVREALEAHLGIKREIPYRDEIIKLIDERIAFYQSETRIKPGLNQSETKVKPELNQDETMVKPDPIATAKRFILAEMDSGREPTTAEVAEVAGIESRPFGVLMRAAGVQAINCHRGGKKARRYTFELREKIEKL
jgi:hypothetical protein